jgi:hypothetical protein
VALRSGAGQFCRVEDDVYLDDAAVCHLGLDDATDARVGVDEQESGAAAHRHRPRTNICSRAPDVGLGGSRLYEQLRHGRFTLVDRTDNGPGERLTADGWSGRAVAVRVPPTGAPGWPALTLIRPDGYIAWASDDTTGQVAAAGAALTDWCGPPSVLHKKHG